MPKIDFDASQYPVNNVVTTYAMWVDTCKLMNAEVMQAKLDHKLAVLEMNAIVAEQKLKVEQLHTKWKKLEMRIKPLPPE